MDALDKKLLSKAAHVTKAERLRFFYNGKVVVKTAVVYLWGIRRETQPHVMHVAVCTKIDLC